MFLGLGNLGEEYQIKLKEGAVPHGETVAAYVAELHHLSEYCNYGDTLDFETGWCRVLTTRAYGRSCFKKLHLPWNEQ